MLVEIRIEMTCEIINYCYELDVGDHLIEVVGLMNSIHVAQVKGGIQAGRRLAQCSSVVIRYVQESLENLILLCCLN